jgi:hypothetical protein
VTYGHSMSKAPLPVHVISPIFDMKQRVEANRTGQADFRRVIAGLKDGAPKSEAERQLDALQRELMALNIEMHVRASQVAGNA